MMRSPRRSCARTDFFLRQPMRRRHCALRPRVHQFFHLDTRNRRERLADSDVRLVVLQDREHFGDFYRIDPNGHARMALDEVGQDGRQQSAREHRHARDSQSFGRFVANDLGNLFQAFQPQEISSTDL